MKKLEVKFVLKKRDTGIPVYNYFLEYFIDEFSI